MASSPTVSVIVPTRDRPEHLSACLRALARVRPPAGGFEVIVADDGGREGVEPVVRAAANGLATRVVRLERSQGPAAARNAAAAGARGRILAFTDDDCRPDPDWLQELAAAVEAHPGAGAGGLTRSALAGNVWAVGSQTVEDAVYAHENAVNADARFFSTKNLAVPTDAFRALGGFDDSMRISEDRDLCARWRARGHALVLAPRATVAHANPRSGRAFWRQHLGYGRGSHRFHAMQVGRDAPGLRPDLRFYARLLGQPWRAPVGVTGPVRLLALLIASQLASAIGYGLEALSARRRAGDS